MRILLGACLLLLAPPARAWTLDLEAERKALLAIHEGFKTAHLASDAEAVLRRLAADYVQVNRGAVTRPDPETMAGRMRSYLTGTRFSEYRDLLPPIVKVSADGTLGWVIVRVRAHGTRIEEDGDRRPIDFVGAWICLFEKRDGEWLNVGDVSTFEE